MRQRFGGRHVTNGAGGKPWQKEHYSAALLARSTFGWHHPNQIRWHQRQGSLLRPACRNLPLTALAPLLLPHPTPCSRQEPGDLLHPHPGGGAERCRPARRLWKAGRQSQMAPPDVTRLPQGRQLGAAGGARKVEPVMPGHPLLIPALLVRRSSPPPPLATSGRQWTPRHECLGGRSISRTRHDVHAWCVAGLCWCSTQKPKKPGPSVPKLKSWVSPLCSYLHPRCSMHCALHLHDVPPHLFPSQLSPDPVLRLFR